MRRSVEDDRSTLSDKFHQFLNDAPPLVLSAKIVSADVSARPHTSDLFRHAICVKDSFGKLHLDILGLTVRGDFSRGDIRKLLRPGTEALP